MDISLNLPYSDDEVHKAQQALHRRGTSIEQEVKAMIQQALSSMSEVPSEPQDSKSLLELVKEMHKERESQLREKQRQIHEAVSTGSVLEMIEKLPKTDYPLDYDPKLEWHRHLEDKYGRNSA